MTDDEAGNPEPDSADARMAERSRRVVRDKADNAVNMPGTTLGIVPPQKTKGELRRRLEDLSRMQQVRTPIQAGNVADLLRDILAAVDITGAQMGNIHLLDRDTLRIAVHQRLPQHSWTCSMRCRASRDE